MSLSGRFFGMSCSSDNVGDMLQNFKLIGFSFIHCPIINPKYITSAPASDCSFLPLVRSDLKLPATDLSSIVVETCCYNRNVPNEGQKCEELLSSRLLEEELMLCMHLGIVSVTVSLKSHCNESLARVLSSVLQVNSNGMEVWACVPLIESTPAARVIDGRPCVTNSSWKLWKKFHCQTGFHSKIGVVIELTAQLPSMVELDRWLSEPIKGILLPTSIFSVNAKGFPVLSVAHQLFIGKVASLCSHFILTGPAKCKTLTEYITYLDYLLDTNDEPDNPNGSLLRLFPQPLVDDFSLTLYKYYESDTAKYMLYQQAIYEALVDRRKIYGNLQVIAILGASRGSLVTATIKAASMAEVQIKLFAVERNTFACQFLEDKNELEWDRRVNICNHNVSNWASPEPFDIIISELLGSFGDQELSPEYLASAHKWLKADGISIPCKFTSFLRPTQSSKLFQVILDNVSKDVPNKCFETPYIALDNSVFHLAPEQVMFTFEHPNSQIPSKNHYKQFIFKIQQDCSLHAFTVFFETKLYKSVVLSSLPSACEDDYRRPMFLPLNKEVGLKEGDDLIFNIWRLSERNIVWYEWAVSMPSQTRIHNICGRSSFYNLS